ncbi:hypothetical protein CC1G_13354 [Coprinopsis cinerea okayama7|uniref:Uncharacterized protein n=1 Tax=Coprinopsis cinerea (strain Okayama-7 / 130 / ATCC MYA-4618 / FGSC 9003) TaxID=240176 RepID=A8P786_COPC7|nr:hypothetical protein CC1G_13354 [Coprinopsis cinerea okayama7\|eukprot:XP_001839313.2 hypothetical protein CC1G_13354 [Coprinopsis cinerea okayama7\
MAALPSPPLPTRAPPSSWVSGTHLPPFPSPPSPTRAPPPSSCGSATHLAPFLSHPLSTQTPPSSLVSVTHQPTFAIPPLFLTQTPPPSRVSATHQPTFAIPPLPSSARAATQSPSLPIAPSPRSAPSLSPAPARDLQPSGPRQPSVVHTIREGGPEVKTHFARRPNYSSSSESTPYQKPSFRGLSPFLERSDPFIAFRDEFLKNPQGYLVEKITETSATPNPPGIVARNKEGYTDVVEGLGIQVFRFSLNEPDKLQIVEIPYNFVPAFRGFKESPKAEIHSVYFVISSPFHFSMDTPCVWDYISGGQPVQQRHPICQKDWKYVPKGKDEKRPGAFQSRNKYRFNPVFLSLSDEEMRNPIRQTIYYWDYGAQPEVLSSVVIEYRFVSNPSKQ